MTRLKRAAVWFGVVLATLPLPACNTVEGLGQDMRSLGQRLRMDGAAGDEGNTTARKSADEASEQGDGKMASSNRSTRRPVARRATTAGEARPEASQQGQRYEDELEAMYRAQMQQNGGR
jgi:predicted small secreted protein